MPAAVGRCGRCRCHRCASGQKCASRSIDPRVRGLRRAADVKDGGYVERSAFFTELHRRMMPVELPLRPGRWRRDGSRPATAHALDDVAAATSPAVRQVDDTAEGPPRNDRLDPWIRQSSLRRVGIMGFVRDQPAGRPHGLRKPKSHADVAQAARRSSPRSIKLLRWPAWSSSRHRSSAGGQVRQPGREGSGGFDATVRQGRPFSGDHK